MLQKDFSITLLILVLWVLLYALNHTLFRFTELTQLTSLIFIPSGFKIAVAAILRGRAWLGLFLGSLITGFVFLRDFSALDVMVLSILSASIPFAALKLGEFVLPLKQDLSNLAVKHILIIGFIYATLNGLFHISYHHQIVLIREAEEIRELLAMIVGDILGILIAMLMIARLSKFDIVQNFLKK